MSERVLTRRQAIRITAAVGAGTAFGLGLGREVIERARLRRVSETRAQMGTLVTLTVVHPDGAAARSMVEGAFAEMERLEAVFSRYRSDSVVGRLNRTGRVVDVPVELLEVLELATDLSTRSGGAFDVTSAPLVDLHAQAFGAGAGPPTDDEIRRALLRVGYDRLRVEGSEIFFADPGMGITLDGIAKGFIVDRVVERMAKGGVDRVLVDAGGDLGTGGDGVAAEPWTIGVQHPRHAEALVGTLALGRGSIATSGDYLRHFTPDRRHHDIMDPRTGRSPGEISSATVTAPSAALADALSTTVLVLGAEEGLRLLETMADVDGLLIDKEGERFLTSGMSSRIESSPSALSLTRATSG